MPVGSPPAIIHAAVADMDATYGAYVIVGNNTSQNNTKNFNIDQSTNADSNDDANNTVNGWTRGPENGW